MLRFGFGTGRSRRRSGSGAAVPPPGISPAAGWTGVAGSGFAAAPVDPTRITAKPAMRMIVPPNQAFSNELLIGVYAGANNAGSLYDNMGIGKVRLHYEGSVVDIAEPSLQTFNDANGNPVTYLGWWARLVQDGRTGDARAFFEAFPKDAAMQKRVIGPFLFLPSSSPYDLELTVAPSLAQVAGSRYTSIAGALTYAASQGKHHPRITITEARNDYLLGPMTGAPFSYTAGKGYATIAASVPVTIIGTAAYADATPRTKYDGLRFRGANITIDYKTMHSIYHEGIGMVRHWFDGCTLLNSGGRGYSVPQLKGPRTASPSRASAYFTECVFNNMPNTVLSAPLARGCVATNSYADFASEAQCVIGCRVDDYNAYADWATDNNAFTVSYGGGGATATLELSGLNNAASRTFTAKVDGVSVGTFVVSTAAATACSAVVAWLNGLAGWSASLQNDNRRASLCSIPLNIGGAFGPQNCKNALLQIVTFYDAHGDAYQQNSPAGLTENVIFADNVMTNFAGQFHFISSTSVANDFLFINNSFHEKPGTGWTFLSQWGRTGAKSHVVFAHNSSTQILYLRPAAGWNADPYCLVANNAINGIAWDGTPDGDIKIDQNHVYAINAAPAGSTGTTTGGDAETFWANAAIGDFTPMGALLAAKRKPAVRFDRRRRKRASLDTAGATAS